MTTYQYLIIGGGMTAAAAADGIREVDSRLETFADWKRPNVGGVIYYLENSRV